MKKADNLEIITPEGYSRVVTEQDGKTIVRFEKVKRLPDKWELDESKNYFFISSASRIIMTDKGQITNICMHNLLPTKRLAEAMLALCQLLVMRDVYNEGWEPDDQMYKHTIRVSGNIIGVYGGYVNCRPLSFKNAELAEKFFENFEDLLEIAKPLL